MLILDTNIWISYALTPSGELGISVQQILEQNDYAFSRATFRELTEVLLRSKLDPYVKRKNRVSFLKIVAEAAQWFQVETAMTDCRDPKDNKFLSLAQQSHASHLITGDQDLLILDPYHNTRIITAQQWRQSVKTTTD